MRHNKRQTMTRDARTTTNDRRTFTKIKTAEVPICAKLGRYR